MAPLVQAKSWLPILAGALALTLTASAYNAHHRHELFAFFAVLIAGFTALATYSLMSSIASLNVTFMLVVYMVWLVRGTIVRPIVASDVGFIASESAGLVASMFLLVLTLLTFMDRQQILATESEPARRVFIALYTIIVLYPHPCSLASSLKWWQMFLRMSVFMTLWYMQDYTYALRCRTNGDCTPLWWLKRTLKREYCLHVIRSTWALFVDDIVLLGSLVVVVAWFSELARARISVSKATPSAFDIIDDDTPADEEIAQPASMERVRRRQVNTSPPPANSHVNAARAADLVLMDDTDRQRAFQQFSRLIRDAVREEIAVAVAPKPVAPQSAPPPVVAAVIASPPRVQQESSSSPSRRPQPDPPLQPPPALLTIKTPPPPPVQTVIMKKPAAVSASVNKPVGVLAPSTLLRGSSISGRKPAAAASPATSVPKFRGVGSPAL